MWILWPIRNEVDDLWLLIVYNFCAACNIITLCFIILFYIFNYTCDRKRERERSREDYVKWKQLICWLGYKTNPYKYIYILYN